MNFCKNLRMKNDILPPTKRQKIKDFYPNDQKIHNSKDLFLLYSCHIANFMILKLLTIAKYTNH